MYIEHAIQTFAHGYDEMLVGEMAKIKGNPMMQCSPPIRVGNAMEQVVNVWEAQHLQVSKMIDLPAAEFVQRKRGLLVCIDNAARDFVVATDFSTEIRAAEKCEQDPSDGGKLRKYW